MGRTAGPDEPRRGGWEDWATSAATADFLRAVGAQTGRGSLTGGALARAAVELVPVDGVGISAVTDELRLPLAGSTAAAEVAEELQTTLGDGPCLVAARTAVPCVVDLAEMLRRWPVYAEELTRRTSFRSAAAVPLRDPDGRVVAALDLYSEDPFLSERLDLDRIAVDIAVPMGALLDLCLGAVRGADDELLPEWYADATLRRFEVRVAIGMVVEQQHGSGGDALSVLRGYAYSRERLLDDVADDVVRGRVAVREVLG